LRVQAEFFHGDDIVTIFFGSLAFKRYASTPYFIGFFADSWLLESHKCASKISGDFREAERMKRVACARGPGFEAPRAAAFFGRSNYKPLAIGGAGDQSLAFPGSPTASRPR
jgi:hypothetical protein